MTNKNLENESLIGFHLIRKSANALASDLRYFKEVPSNFSDSQIANILGEIEEVEEYIKTIRQIISKKAIV
jgi:hypothetical protein